MQCANDIVHCIGHHCHQLPSMASITGANIRRAKPHVSSSFSFSSHSSFFLAVPFPYLPPSTPKIQLGILGSLCGESNCFWQFKHSSSHIMWLYIMVISYARGKISWQSLLPCRHLWLHEKSITTIKLNELRYQHGTHNTQNSFNNVSLTNNITPLANF